MAKKKGRPRAPRRMPLAPPDGLSVGQKSFLLRRLDARGKDTDRARLYDELFSAFGGLVTVTPPGGLPYQTEAMESPSPTPRPGELPDAMIAARERLYTATGDPLRAWEAYWIAVRTGRAIPAWVASYFECVARRMIDFSRQQPTGKKRAAAVMAALELNVRGRGAVSATRALIHRRQQYAVDVMAIVAKGYTESAAIGHVVEIHGISERRTVEDAVNHVKGKGWLVPGGSTGLPSPTPAARDFKPL